MHPEYLLGSSNGTQTQTLLQVLLQQQSHQQAHQRELLQSLREANRHTWDMMSTQFSEIRQDLFRVFEKHSIMMDSHRLCHAMLRKWQRPHRILEARRVKEPRLETLLASRPASTKQGPHKKRLQGLPRQRRRPRDRAHRAATQQPHVSPGRPPRGQGNHPECKTASGYRPDIHGKCHRRRGDSRSTATKRSRGCHGDQKQFPFLHSITFPESHKHESTLSPNIQKRTEPDEAARSKEVHLPANPHAGSGQQGSRADSRAGLFGCGLLRTCCVLRTRARGLLRMSVSRSGCAPCLPKAPAIIFWRL